jgi:hypothetical protein
MTDGLGNLAEAIKSDKTESNPETEKIKSLFNLRIILIVNAESTEVALLRFW